MIKFDFYWGITMIGINESLEHQCKLAELRQSIYEKIKPCNHECKDSVVREVAYITR